MLNAEPVFRFAPSPNGYLHLGHGFSALFTQAMARRHGGRLLLRIENIDLDRARPEFEEAIYEDLAWLGVEWGESVRRQSEHFDVYAATIARLGALGLLYPCFATRREIIEAMVKQGKMAPHGPDGAPIYPGLCRNMPASESEARIAAGDAHTLRLNMEMAIALAREMTGGPILIHSIGEEGGRVDVREASPQRWGDVVLARKQVPTSYHVSVVSDDALQGVTHVTRGMDLYHATDIHRLLQILLDLPEPIYCHHRLILDPLGRKLSKSFQDNGLRALRAEGITPAQIREFVGFSGNM